MMDFLKIYAKMIFLMILLSLKGFYSYEQISDNFCHSSPLIQVEPNSPSSSTDLDFTLEETRVAEERIICKAEINAHFPDDKTPRDYIKHAFKELTLSDDLPYYLIEYYKQFYNYVSKGDVPTTGEYCSRIGELFEGLPSAELDYETCKETIISFICIDRQRSLLYNALYNITLKQAESFPYFIWVFLNTLSTIFGLNLTPGNNVPPFLNPLDFCESFIRIDATDQEQQEHQEPNIHLDNVQ